MWAALAVAWCALLLAGPAVSQTPTPTAATTPAAPATPAATNVSDINITRAEIFPDAISASALRDDGPPATRTVVVVFPDSGEDVLDLRGIALWERFVAIHAEIDEDGNTLPFGYNGLRTELCPDNACVSLVPNASAVQIQLLPAPDFDIFVPQRVVVTVGVRIMPRRLSPLEVSFSIVPSEEAPHPVSYFLTAMAIGTHVASSFAFPATMDTGGLLVATQMTCSRQSERLWLPAALYAALPFGGDTLFERTWRLGTFLAAVYLLLFLLLKFHTLARVSGEKARRIRDMLPFVGGQLLLFLAPGLSFSAGFLVTSPSPTFQVLGVCVAVVLLLVLYSLNHWLYADETWVYDPLRYTIIPATAREHVWDQLTLRGYWHNTEMAFRVTKILPREVRGDLSWKIVLLLWFGGLGLFFAAGLSPATPFGCVAQCTCVSFAWALAAIFVLRVKPYRAKILNAASVAVRVLTCLAYLLIALGPSPAKWPLFITVVCLFIAVAGPRLGYGATYMRFKTSEAARARASTAATSDGHALEVPLKDVSGTEAAIDAEVAAANDMAGHTLHESTDFVEIDFPEDEKTERDGTVDDATSNGTGVENTTFDLDEPKFIREASKVKPKVSVTADRCTNDRMWLPRARPNVRSHNEPDLPLRPSPFMKRGKSPGTSAPSATPPPDV